MSSNAWLRVDRFMRSVHLYTGLFLLPWMIVYATSGFFFNHSPWFARWFSYSRQSLEVVRKLDLPAGSIPTGDPAATSPSGSPEGRPGQAAPDHGRIKRERAKHLPDVCNG